MPHEPAWAIPFGTARGRGARSIAPRLRESTVLGVYFWAERDAGKSALSGLQEVGRIGGQDLVPGPYFFAVHPHRSLLDEPVSGARAGGESGVLEDVRELC